MSDKLMSQYLPADLFLKSAAVEKNPDMSFREAVAEFFGVSPEEITRIRRTKDAKGWDITIENMYEPSLEDEDYQWDLGPEEYWDEEDAEESDGKDMNEHRVVYNEEAGLLSIYLDGKIQGEQEMYGDDYPETEIWKILMEYFPEEDKDELQAIADEVYYNGSHIWYT
jgi:hypothetical protein